jgi:ribonuclease P protein component
MIKQESNKLFLEGKKVYTKTFKIILSDEVGFPIISAPKKIFKKAVDRNKIKRLIRESIKNSELENKKCFIIYNSKEIKNFWILKNELLSLKSK